MKPQLNHVIVWSLDRRAAADFFAEIAEMGPPTEFAHFTQVETGNGVTLDWADPRRSQPGRINHHDAGRGVYVQRPARHRRVGDHRTPLRAGPVQSTTSG